MHGQNHIKFLWV